MLSLLSDLIDIWQQKTKSFHQKEIILTESFLFMLLSLVVMTQLFHFV